jgi:hypothetical protein
MCIGQQQSDLLLEEGELIKQCTEYKYLGMKINSEGTHVSEINERIKLGRYATATLNSIWVEQERYKRKEKSS